MIKAIIFDADGVLIHTERFSTTLEREQGITMEQTAPFFAEKFHACRIGAADLKEEIAPYLESWGWTKGVDAFLEYWFDIEYNLDKDLIKYIEELRKKGVVCMLGTNQEKRRFDYMSEKIGFKDIFDRVYVSAHLGCAKPEHEYFDKILLDLPGISKGEILLVDDRQEHIDSAEKFGIHGEFYTSLENLKKKIESLA
jgi:putative hydrolase of the HAD superfamily